MSPRLAIADPARLDAVSSYRLSGHEGDPDLDRVVAHIARILRVPMAVINLVGPDLQCYPAEHGIGAASTKVPDEVTFCAYVVAGSSPLMIPDARNHPAFSANPLVVAGKVSSYLGVPLIDQDGFVLGALSVFETQPREFTEEERDLLQSQAHMVRVVLSLRRRVAAHEWDAQLLSTQSRVLEEVATGAPLSGALELVATAVRDLSPGADPPRLQTLQATVDRLTTIATDAHEHHRDSKLESLGRLAAGLAHEINSPIQFVGDNARFLAEAYQDLIRIVLFYRGLLDSTDPIGWEERRARMRVAEEGIEFEYLQAEIPSAVEQTLHGIDRVSTIVRAMKMFSHPGHKEQVPADLNESLAATITVARHQVKSVAELNLELGELPPVRCNIADLNQVFLNLIVNAADAIEEAGQRGTISVMTRLDGDQAVITINDTGGGIPEEIRSKIFDPFFTTKDVGRGSGQGLPLVRAVVQEGHGGALAVDTEIGVGTTFTIRLPVGGKP